MPSIKKSVMFSEQTQAYIDARTRSDDQIAWSQALNEGFKALQWLTAESLPELTEGEWETILNVFSGSIIEFTPPFRIASDMMDDKGAIALEELDPEYAALVKKMHALSQVEQFAVLDFVQKFWAKDWKDCSDFAEIAAAIKKI